LKAFFSLAILVALFGCNSPSENKTETPATDLANDSTSILEKYPVLTWLRKNPAEIGCMIESELHYRDSVFNCDYKNYKNKGDPCNHEKEYYEGVHMPDSVAEKIHPLIMQCLMDFEAGSLQQLSITFKDSLPINRIKELFQLPVQKDSLPENVISIDFGEDISSKDKPVSSGYTRWLVIIGFEHMGAGDVDCE
jgi:hypothetical protein